MTWKKRGPRGLPTAATHQRTVSDAYCIRRLPESKPAYCPWHRSSFREAFPPRCPCSTPNPVTTAARMQDAGWRELGKNHADPSADHEAARELLDQTETCIRCLERGLAHPVVRRLRRREGLT